MVMVILGLEEHIDNSVGVAMVHNHYILITTGSVDRKSTCVVCAEFDAWFNMDAKFVG